MKPQYKAVDLIRSFAHNEHIYLNACLGEVMLIQKTMKKSSALPLSIHL